MEKKWQKILLAISIVVVLTILALIIWRFAEPLVTMIQDPDRARAWVDERGIWASIIFIFVMALQVIVAVIPGGPLQVGAGYAFGPVQGFILSMIAILIGSMTVFLLVKRFGRRVIRLFFSDEKIDNIELLHDPRRLNAVTFLLFLIPGTPKDLLTYVIGLTPMPLKTWLVICIFSRMPSVAVSIISGNAIQEQSYGEAAIWFIALALLSILGYVLYVKWNAREKRRRLLRHHHHHDIRERIRLDGTKRVATEHQESSAEGASTEAEEAESSEPTSISHKKA